MLGNGTSGVLVSVLKILCKAAFPQNDEGTRMESRVYFGVGAALLCGCLWAISRVRRMGYIGRGGGGALVEEIERAEIELASLTVGGVPSDSAPKQQDDDTSMAALFRTYRSLLSLALLPTLTVFLTFVLTLSLYPGVTSLFPATFGENGWFAVTLAAAFNVGDWGGRGAASLLVSRGGRVAEWVLPAVGRGGELRNFGKVAGLGAVRLAFYALFAMAARGAIRDSLGVMLLVFVMAGTSGFVVTTCMVVGPMMVDDAEKKERVNSLLLVALFLGLAVGVTLGDGIKGVMA
jgi:equilibrative nucleoside transporter 1/2/3